MCSHLEKLNGEGRRDDDKDQDRREDEENQVLRLLILRRRPRILDLCLLDERNDELGRRETQEDRKPDRRTDDAADCRAGELEG